MVFKMKRMVHTSPPRQNSPPTRGRGTVQGEVRVTVKYLPGQVHHTSQVGWIDRVWSIMSLQTWKRRSHHDRTG